MEIKYLILILLISQTHPSSIFTDADGGRSEMILDGIETRGISVNIQDEEGKNLLHHLLKNSRPYSSDSATILYLMNKGIDINKLDHYGCLPIHYAISKLDYGKILTVFANSKIDKTIPKKCVEYGNETYPLISKNRLNIADFLFINFWMESDKWNLDGNTNSYTVENVAKISKTIFEDKRTSETPNVNWQDIDLNKNIFLKSIAMGDTAKTLSLIKSGSRPSFKEINSAVLLRRNNILNIFIKNKLLDRLNYHFIKMYDEAYFENSNIESSVKLDSIIRSIDLDCADDGSNSCN